MFCLHHAAWGDRAGHPRNHALIAKSKDWRLSPAYDLTPATPVSIEHRDLSLICGDRGRFANAENLLSQSGRFLLEPGDARALIARMETQVRHEWYRIARSAGVSERDCGKIAPAFAYPGFGYPREEGVSTTPGRHGV